MTTNSHPRIALQRERHLISKNRRRFGAVVRLEVKRAKRHFLVPSSLAGTLWFVLWVADKDSPLAVSTMLFAATGVVALAVPTQQFKDKLDGGMEFVSTLPVHGATLATARLVATALCAVPSALVAAGLTKWIAIPELGLDEGLNWPLAAFAGTWALITAATYLLTGLMIRLDVGNAAKAVTTIFASGCIVSIVADRWVGEPIPILVGLLTGNPHAIVRRVVASALLAAVITILAGFLLARDGYNRYRPESEPTNAV